MDFILEYWDSQGEKFGQSSDASWKDEFMLEIEFEMLSRKISEYYKNSSLSNVLDAGCASGFVLKKLEKAFHILNGVGIDFSPNLINSANLNNDSTKLTFKVSDIRNIECENNYFDLVFTNRVLINLPNWEEQQKALNELYRVLKPEGVMILQEAFWEGLVNLNSHRLLSSLEPLVEHDFNRYLKMNKIRDYFADHKIEVRFFDTSSIYYFGTRLVREVFTDENEFKSAFNANFKEMQLKFGGSEIPAEGFDIPGIQRMMVVKKSNGSKQNNDIK